MDSSKNNLNPPNISDSPIKQLSPTTQHKTPHKNDSIISRISNKALMNNFKKISKHKNKLIPRKTKIPLENNPAVTFKKFKERNLDSLKKPSLHLNLQKYVLDQPFNLSKIKQLMLHAAGQCLSPSWAKLQGRVKRIVLVTVDGLSESLMRENSSDFEYTASFAEKVLPVTIPFNLKDDQTIYNYYNRCTKAIKGLKIDMKKAGDSVSPREMISLENFLMDETQLAENDFPGRDALVKDEAFFSLNERVATENDSETIPDHLELKNIKYVENAKTVKTIKNKLSESKSENIISDGLTDLASFSKVEIKSGERRHIAAVDCEMVLTAKGQELARCTVVDFTGRTIYDELVKPDSVIVDYCTQYSGVDEEMMKGVTKRLKDVQNDLNGLLSSESILVGHSLENDLDALKLCHDRIIDTSVLYPHHNGPPWKYSLRFLAKKFMRKNIQNGENGHNSAEDALAALDLLKLKFSNGLRFGCWKPEFESLWAVFKRAGWKSAFIGAERSAKMTDAQNLAVIVPSNGSDESLSKMTKLMRGESPFHCEGKNESNGESHKEKITENESIETVEKKTNSFNSKQTEKTREETLKSFLEAERTFVWISLTSKNNGPKKRQLTPSEIDDAVENVRISCGKDCLLFVMTGHLTDSIAAKLHEERKSFKKENPSKEWVKEEEYNERIAKLKEGVCLVNLIND